MLIINGSAYVTFGNGYFDEVVFTSSDNSFEIDNISVPDSGATIKLPNGSGQCHGSCFYDADTIGLSTNKHYLFFIDKVSGEIIAQYNLPYHIKDMCTISPGEMMLYFAINSLSAQQEPTYASGLLHISLNFEVKSLTIKNKKFFRPAAFEAIFLDKNSATFYIPDQFGGRVILVRLRENKIHVDGEIRGFDFPHGVAVHKSQLPVTNYGNSTIEILNLSEVRIDDISGKTSKQRPYTVKEIMGVAKRYTKLLGKKLSQFRKTGQPNRRPKNHQWILQKMTPIGIVRHR